MAIEIGTAGGNMLLTAVWVGTAGGNRQAIEVWAGTAAGAKLVFSSLSVAATPDSVSGSRTGAGLVTSDATSAVASGGVGPYSYAWSQVSGDPMTITAPTSSSTAFSAEVAAAEVLNAVMRVTASDASGATASDEVAVQLQSIS